MTFTGMLQVKESYVSACLRIYVSLGTNRPFGCKKAATVSSLTKTLQLASMAILIAVILGVTIAQRWKSIKKNQDYDVRHCAVALWHTSALELKQPC